MRIFILSLATVSILSSHTLATKCPTPEEVIKAYKDLVLDKQYINKILPNVYYVVPTGLSKAIPYQMTVTEEKLKSGKSICTYHVDDKTFTEIWFE